MAFKQVGQLGWSAELELRFWFIFENFVKDIWLVLPELVEREYTDRELETYVLSLCKWWPPFLATKSSSRYRRLSRGVASSRTCT